MKLEDLCSADLRLLDTEGKLRTARTVDSPQGRTCVVGGRTMLCFCANDYLGLANHPRVIGAVASGLQEWGVGAAASRLITGTMRPHRRLERDLARWVRAPDAVLFSSGYALNVSLLPAIAGEDDLIISDRLNHASLIDGCRLSRAETQIVEHANVSAFRAALRKPARRKYVVTESVFSMDGDEAPLSELRAICDNANAFLVVDEAHALGVFGPQGGGLAREAGVIPDITIGTLGKSLGGSGAFAAGGTAVAQVLRNRARGFVFSTASPPALALGIREALLIAEASDGPRERLTHQSIYVRNQLGSFGYQVPNGRSPIIPVIIGAIDETMRLSHRLWEAGIWAQGIRPPTVPEGSSRIRITLSANHRPSDIDALIDAFRQAR